MAHDFSSDFSSDFSWPIQDPQVKHALDAAFASGDWGRYDGENCQILRDDLSDYFSCKQVRLCSSGTVAVEIAIRAANVKQDDEVILAAYDFPGNFRCIEAAGAMPVLVDIDRETLCMSAQQLQNAITDKTKAILVSYLHGGIAPIEQIAQIANKNNVALIEDICQCPGAMVNYSNAKDSDAKDLSVAKAPNQIADHKKLGTFGDITTLSFGGSKLLTAGRGGAVITNNETFAQRATIFCDRGNDTFPLSELQAAVLVPQLAQLDKRNEARLESARSLLTEIGQLNTASTIKNSDADLPAFFKLPILVGDPNSKQDVIDQLKRKGIKIDHGFRGFAKRSKRRCRIASDCSNAIDIAERIMVLHHPCLLSENFPLICEEILNALRAR